MKIITKKQVLLNALTPYKVSAKKIGFVPTMGALHKGHVSLVSQALTTNDCVVVSIFVNPTQFDNALDLKKYPKTLDKDVALLSTLEGIIIIYHPQASELYNGKIRSKSYNFGPIANEMEGKFRTGHFNGVGTVVNLLLRDIKPDTAYFGQKDFQQLQIVKKLVAIENLPVQIVGCPIVREENGLAMSSRNKRLSKKQVDEAALIHQTLLLVKNDFPQSSIPKLNSKVEEIFKKSKVLTLEYFEIADEASLKTAKRKQKETKYRAFIAAFIGPVRLIDNMALN